MSPFFREENMAGIIPYGIYAKLTDRCFPERLKKNMDWTVWILLSAVFLAFYDIAKKASVRNNAVLPTPRVCHLKISKSRFRPSPRAFFACGLHNFMEVPHASCSPAFGTARGGSPCLLFSCSRLDHARRGPARNPSKGAKRTGPGREWTAGFEWT